MFCFCFSPPTSTPQTRAKDETEAAPKAPAEKVATALEPPRYFEPETYVPTPAPMPPILEIVPAKNATMDRVPEHAPPITTPCTTFRTNSHLRKYIFGGAISAMSYLSAFRNAPAGAVGKCV